MNKETRYVVFHEVEDDYGNVIEHELLHSGLTQSQAEEKLTDALNQDCDAYMTEEENYLEKPQL